MEENFCLTGKISLLKFNRRFDKNFGKNGGKFLFDRKNFSAKI